MQINKTYGKLDAETTVKTDLYRQKIQSFYQKIKNLDTKNSKVKILAIKKIHNLRKNKFISLNVNFSEDYCRIQGTDDEFDNEHGLLSYITLTYPNTMIMVIEFRMNEFLNTPEETPRNVLIINTIGQEAEVVSYSI